MYSCSRESTASSAWWWRAKAVIPGSPAARARRTAVAAGRAAFRADSRRDGDSAQLRQHAGAPLLRAGDRAAAVFRLQQPAVAVAGLGGAGQAESMGRDAV